MTIKLQPVIQISEECMLYLVDIMNFFYWTDKCY